MPNVLPAHIVPPFDPQHVFAERIGERKIVYLDNNIWIDLRDARTDAHRRCYEACLRAVTEQRAVFPVSYASVSELLEIASPELRIQQADVMDSLCCGLTFRNFDLIHGLEAEDVFRHLFFDTPPEERRREAFTMLLDYTGAFGLQVPEGLRPTDVESFLRDGRNEMMAACRLRWLVDHFDQPQTLRNHIRVNTYSPQIDAQRAAHREHLGVEQIDREVLAHEERVPFYHRLVVPVLQRAALSRGDLMRVQERGRELGANSRRMLRRPFRAAAPSMETMVQLFTRQAQDVRRRTERQDFWDAEHAVLAFAYADAFVTADRGLNEGLRLGNHRPPGARAVMLPSVEALTAWLDAGLAANASA